jgi:hypothetical protein
MGETQHRWGKAAFFERGKEIFGSIKEGILDKLNDNSYWGDLAHCSHAVICHACIAV